MREGRQKKNKKERRSTKKKGCEISYAFGWADDERRKPNIR